MKLLRALVPIVSGSLIVLTYLLLQGTIPDAARHERTLDALRTVILYNAALQRDVLRARTGLLRNYDPLVRSVENLRQATAGLPSAREVATDEARADIDRRVETVTAAVQNQEALVEKFKSDNALLQNSLTYFYYASGQMAATGDSLQTAEIGALTTAMLRFVGDPQSDSAKEVTASLDRLAQLPADVVVMSKDVYSLVAHGRLIVAILPVVDGIVARMQAAPTTGEARALQDLYLDAHARAAARAQLFQTLLYIAALILVAYVVYLFVRLHANARILRERLEFERMIASISTQFINLPHGDIRDDVSNGLARLVEYADLDCAQIIVSEAGKADLSRSYLYCRSTVSMPSNSLKDVADLVLNWSLEGHERQGCICVLDVRELPESRERTALQARRVLSWLCIPMRVAGKPLGFLALDALREEKRWLDDDIALLRTAAEIFANAIARERSEAERDALHARLNQSQRLEAIGTLAGGIAHEFNNILGAILGYGEMALAVLLSDSRARRYVEQIMKAGERAQGVVEQVLAFGRRRERQHQPMQAEPTVAEAVDLLRASLPATLSMRTRLRGGNAAMMGDPTEFQQVVMNLGTNAAQAMNSRGVLELDLDTIERGESFSLSHGSLPAGCYIRLIVRDTGHGMDRATIERIFEPFFTTKPAGQGTGLGLSTVHGIVSEHGGAINVTSRTGEGTTFELYFPQTEQAAAPNEETFETPGPRGHGETILIVDDDKQLVLLGEEMLAALGYEPVGFNRSLAALTAFRSDPERFDLALTDEVMPEMTGTEFADALHEVRPDLPIVLMTGYEKSAGSHRPLRKFGIREVIKKPLLSAAIAQCLARHLH